MSHRTDPMYYDLEIQEIKTGKKNTAQVACWWSGDHSIRHIHGMCDCQLAGYYFAQPTPYRENGVEKVSWSNAFTIAQNNYLKANACKHGPAKKFRPLLVTLPGGETIELTEKAAA